MLEKDKKVVGGTTAKSGGIFWIPNNPIMQREGLEDNKEDCLAYLARKARTHPHNMQIYHQIELCSLPS